VDLSPTRTSPAAPCPPLPLLGWVSAGGISLVSRGGRALGLCDAPRLQDALASLQAARNASSSPAAAAAPCSAASCRLVLYCNQNSSWLRPALLYVGV
jgi:hypothetical protein